MSCTPPVVRRQGGGSAKRVTTLRHCFATTCWKRHRHPIIPFDGFGHNNLSTTARYTRVASTTIRNTASPLDRLRLEVVPPA